MPRETGTDRSWATSSGLFRSCQSDYTRNLNCRVDVSLHMKPTPRALAIWRLAVATIVSTMAAVVIAFALSASADSDIDPATTTRSITEAMR